MAVIRPWPLRPPVFDLPSVSILTGLPFQSLTFTRTVVVGTLFASAASLMMFAGLIAICVGMLALRVIGAAALGLLLLVWSFTLDVVWLARRARLQAEEARS